MMAKGILIQAFMRPRYLYVTLDALFRVSNIKSWGVAVYVDGNAETRHDIEETVKQFNIRHTVYRDSHVGNLVNLHLGLRDMFSRGYNEVLYIDCDIILRTDVLDYLSEAPRDVCFVSVSAAGYGKKSIYCPLGNLITRSNFLVLDNWVKNKRYVGLQRPSMPDTLTKATTGYDGVYYAFLVTFGLESLFAPIHYAAHFGIIGWNNKNPNIDTVEVEKRMFAGDSDKWFSNTLKEFYRTDQVKDVRDRFIPESFIYE